MDARFMLCGLVAACVSSPVLAQQTATASGSPLGSPQAPADAAAGTTGAGSSAPDAASVGDIVVTALRNSVSLQRAPAAITSVSEAQLKTQGVTDIRSFQTLVPEAHFGIENTSTQVFIRGVGSALDFYWVPESVAINIDGVYIPRYATAGSFLDVGSVEVLPGPQGVLYGRSAGGGAIVVSSNAPLHKQETTALFETGTYGLVHVSAVENLPISDTLAVRGGVEYIRHSGYQNLGQFAQDSLAAKLALAYHPTSALTVTLRGSYYRDTGKPASTTYVPSPYKNAWYTGVNDQVTGLPLGNENRNFKYYIVSGNINYDFGFARLDYTAGRLQQDTQETRALVGNVSLLDDHYVQYTQSLKLSNGTGAKLSWIVGGDWFDAHARYTGLFGPNQFGTIFDPITQKSYSAYAQLTYSIRDNIRLVGGGRYSVDKLKLTGTSSACFFGQCFYPPITFDRTYHNGDFKAGVEADLAPHVLAYANIQSGYAPGSLNTFTDASGLNKDIKPQDLLAYTAGLKTRLADQRVTLNLEGYYYRYKDLIIQAFDILTGQADLFNAPRATIYGLNLMTSFRIDVNDKLSGSVAYTHGRYGHYVPGGAGNPDLYGLQMQYTPTWSGSGSYEHIFRLGNGGNVTADVSTYFSSKFWGTFIHSPQTFQSAYTKTDLTVTYSPPSAIWSVSAWVKNVENTAVNASVSASGYAAPYQAVTYLEPPRTAGMRFQLKF